MATPCKFAVRRIHARAVAAGKEGAISHLAWHEASRGAGRGRRSGSAELLLSWAMVAVQLWHGSVSPAAEPLTWPGKRRQPSADSPISRAACFCPSLAGKEQARREGRNQPPLASGNSAAAHSCRRPSVQARSALLVQPMWAFSMKYKTPSI
uniref:Uncharacterized protein n=1 Tax=Sphaerodactylus townsendi TaxID=933632 RepID=A0ACB8ERW2_9SAUR